MGINCIVKYTKIENVLFYIAIIFHNITVIIILHFDQINAALVSIRDFFEKQYEILPIPNF